MALSIERNALGISIQACAAVQLSNILKLPSYNVLEGLNQSFAGENSTTLNTPVCYKRLEVCRIAVVSVVQDNAPEADKLGCPFVPISRLSEDFSGGDDGVRR